VNEPAGLVNGSLHDIGSTPETDTTYIVFAASIVPKLASYTVVPLTGEGVLSAATCVAGMAAPLVGTSDTANTVASVTPEPVVVAIWNVTVPIVRATPIALDAGLISIAPGVGTGAGVQVFAVTCETLGAVTSAFDDGPAPLQPAATAVIAKTISA